MCNTLTTLKIEADIGADPIWCAVCYENLELADFALPEELAKALSEWTGDYGTWIDWETDSIIAGGIALEAEHNVIGEQLTEQVKTALAGHYDVLFSHRPLRNVRGHRNGTNKSLCIHAI